MNRFIDWITGKKQREADNRLTVRDYFIGMALTGLLSNPKFELKTPGEFAEAAHDLADAVIARNKKHV